MNTIALLRRPGLLAALAIGVAGMSLALTGSAAVDAQTPPAARVLMESTFPMPETLAPPSGSFSEVVHYVVEYAPGAQTVTHSHPYGCVATVVEGQITNAFRTSAQVTGAGKTVVTPGKQPGRHLNNNATKAVYFASCFATSGEPFATPDDKAPAPALAASVLFTNSMSLAGAPPAYNVVQRVIDLDPGASTGQRKLNGAAMFTVLSGSMTLRSGDGERRLNSGQSYNGGSGDVYTATQAGATATRVVATYLLPIGMQAESPGGAAAASAPGGGVRPPSTGDGGLAD